MDTFLHILHQVLLVDDPLGRLIVDFIGVLTAVCLVITFGLIVYALWEWNRIRALKALDSPDRETLLEKYRRGVLGERLVLLDQSRAQRQIVDKEALSAIARSQLEGGLLTQFVRYVAGTLIIIGLLGTFVGFGRIVVEVRDILASIPTDASVSEVMESIRTALGQMDDALSGLTIAFATSVAGVLGTLIVGLACLGIDVAQTCVLRNLESVTLVKLMPLFSSGVEAAIVRVTETLEQRSDTLAKHLVRFTSVIEEGIRTVNERIESVVNKTMEEERQFVAELKEIRRAVAETAVGIASALDASSKTFADSVERARTEATGTVDEIGHRLTELNTALEGAGALFTKHVGGAAVNFSGSVENSGREFSKQVEAGAKTLQQGSGEAATALIQAGSSLGGQIDGAATTFSGWVGNSGRLFSDSVGTAAKTLVDSSNKGAEDLKKMVREVVEPLPTLVDRFATVTENQRGAADGLRDSVKQLTAAMQDTDRRIIDLNVDGRNFVDVISEFANVMIARETNLQASEILFDEWMGKAAAALEEVTRNLGSSMTADISGLRRDVRETGAGVRGTVAEIKQSGTQVRDLVAELSRIAQQLQGERGHWSEDRPRPPLRPSPKNQPWYQRIFSSGRR